MIVDPCSFQLGLHIPGEDVVADDIVVDHHLVRQIFRPFGFFHSTDLNTTGAQIMKITVLNPAIRTSIAGPDHISPCMGDFAVQKLNVCKKSTMIAASTGAAKRVFSMGTPGLGI